MQRISVYVSWNTTEKKCSRLHQGNKCLFLCVLVYLFKAGLIYWMMLSGSRAIQCLAVVTEEQDSEDLVA